MSAAERGNGAHGFLAAKKERRKKLLAQSTV